ncbi:MAG: magnesium transporter, partial [Leisingera sp.]
MSSGDNITGDLSQDDAYDLDRTLVAQVRDAVDRGDQGELTALLEDLHAADIADLLEQVSPQEREDLIRLYDREFDGEILSELDESIREEVIEILNPAVLAEA